MPSMPLKFCKHPSCSELTSTGYCPEHQVQHDREQADANRKYNRDRGSSRVRGYNNQWERVRAIKLQLNPLCEMCDKQGLTVRAEMVHHVKPIDEGGARLELSNLMSLCNACHEKIHGRDRWRRRG